MTTRHRGEFRAGAAAVDVTPQSFPVIVNGSFLPKIASSAESPLFVRALVLDKGDTRLALAVVDSGLIPRELLDRAKSLAEQSSGIPASRMLVSATHSHATPSVMGALGSDVDRAYADWLPGRIAEAIVQAADRLAPARAGWTAVDDWEHTNCRRWITHPAKPVTDPFGRPSARAMMHPGHENPDFVAPSGPVDPGLTLLSVRHADGRPLAVLANYSMHYFSSAPVSPDYYGRFAQLLGVRLGAEPGGGFVAMMSQGTSGDLQWIDYSRPRRWTHTLDAFAGEMVEVAARALGGIEHHDDVPLAMTECLLTLRRRTPDHERLAWARSVIARLKGELPADRESVFAREQLLLRAEPKRELRFQAVRVGGLGITAMPAEAFGLTGLKIKARSPFPVTMNITIANGAEGYAPPAEQHALGGYVTWPARTAGLEVSAERRITRLLLGLLEQVAGRPRRRLRPAHGPYARAVLALNPHAYWRMEEMGPPVARDASGNRRHARYEGLVAFHLPGAQVPEAGVNDTPQYPSPFSGARVNRAPHLAGGCIAAQLPELPATYSLSLWFWSGLPAQSAPESMRLFARGAGQEEGTESLELLGGAGGTARLAFRDAADRLFAGGADIVPRHWHNVVLVRGAAGLRVYLDGGTRPEIALGPGLPPGPHSRSLRLGGPGGFGCSAWEGRIDEAALFDQELSPEAVAQLFQTASAHEGGCAR